MTKIYVVQHSGKMTADFDDVKMIGVYATYDDALAAVQRLKTKGGFADFPEIVTSENGLDEGFHIDRYEIGKDKWAEGFVTL